MFVSKLFRIFADKYRRIVVNDVCFNDMILWVQGAGAILVGKTKQAFAVYSITFGKLGGGKNEITEEQ